MTTLAEDLILLTVGMRPKTGPDTSTLPGRMPYGLRGAELVSLAQAGRVEVVQNRIVVRDPAPTGDMALDWLLAGLASKQVPPPAKEWVATAGMQHVKYYFERLATAGALQAVPYRLLLLVKVTAYVLADQNAFLDARRRLDEVVMATGPVDAAQTALAGMVYAAGLDDICFPGAKNQAVRDRLKFLVDPNVRAAAAAVAAARLPQAQRGEPMAPYLDPNLLWPQQPGQLFDQPPGRPSVTAAHHAAAQAAGAAAAQAGAQAAGDAAVHAAVHAATSAAVSASVQAAVCAATEAAHHHSSTSWSDGDSSHHHSSSSGSSDSGGGGGHHH